VGGLSERGVAPSRATLARGLLALLAIVLIAWFAVLARNHEIATSASSRVVSEPGMGAADWERAMDDLERADLLDPSSQWSLVRAQYLLLRDRRAALKVADDVLRSEPDNLAAWWVVLRAARELDRQRWREAGAQIERLNPTPSAR
jgi:hypothetical protein